MPTEGHLAGEEFDVAEQLGANLIERQLAERIPDLIRAVPPAPEIGPPKVEDNPTVKQAVKSIKDYRERELRKEPTPNAAEPQKPK